jgi:hypothetical protein
VLLGKGTGSFGKATKFRVGSQPTSIAIGDLNADDDPDLATANGRSDNVSVLLAGVAPPETWIINGAPKKTTKTAVRFKFVASDSRSSFRCKLDKRRWKRCASPKTVKRLDDGRHKFKVRAIDAAGNVDPPPAKDKFKVVGSRLAPSPEGDQARPVVTRSPTRRGPWHPRLLPTGLRTCHAWQPNRPAAG